LTNEDARVVLYVEDSAVNVRLVERILARRPDVRLVAAGEGRQGLALAREHRPALVFLDLHLPDMSGEDVLQELRADPATASAFVVVISADTTPGLVERLRRLGATGHLVKPYDIPGLLRFVDEVGPDGEEVLDTVIVATLRAEWSSAEVHDLVTAFLDDSRLRLAELEQAVATGDGALGTRAAHTLAGGSATFSARTVARLSREVEAVFEEGAFDGARALLPPLRHALADAEVALRREFPPA
jgi:CheY-like chemotaxis protein